MNLPLDGDASSQAHAVLDRVSPAYPPVAGGLHTRYAPVRRSPAQYCYCLLPLDLHVLSLPLAFILSQDQTLHGNYLLLSKVCLSPGFPLARSPGSGLAARPVYSLASCYCFCRSLSMNSPFRVRLKSHRPRLPPCPVSGLPAAPVFTPPLPFGGAKVHLFSEPPNFPRKIFRKVFSPRGSRPLSPAPLPPNRTAKVLLFPVPPNFFQRIFREPPPKTP